MIRKHHVKKFKKIGLVVSLMALTIVIVNLVMRVKANAAGKLPVEQATIDPNKSSYPLNDLLIGLRQPSQANEEGGTPVSYALEVPLDNQMLSPALSFGCEVTALGMVLKYYGYQTNKNELQAEIKTVPFEDEKGLRGNPNLGFVGDATGEQPGAGVFYQPVANLAKRYVEEKYEVIGTTNENLAQLLEHVKNGNPVWVVTTIDYTIPTDKDFNTWQTAEGPIEFSPKHHAAVITGFDTENVFINDPYGMTVKVKREIFQQIFERMGSQSIYLTAKGIL